MDTEILEQLKAIIMKDETFDAEVKASEEDQEILFPRLLKKRGLDLSYEEFQLGVEQMFSHIPQKKNQDPFDDELSDEELELVVGGVNACTSICTSITSNPTKCLTYCG